MYSSGIRFQKVAHFGKLQQIKKNNIPFNTHEFMST